MNNTHFFSKLTVTGLLALSLTGCSAEALQILNSALTKVPSKQELATQKSSVGATANRPAAAPQAPLPQVACSQGTAQACGERLSAPRPPVQGAENQPMARTTSDGRFPPAEPKIIDIGDCPDEVRPGTAPAPACAKPAERKVLDTDFEI